MGPTLTDERREADEKFKDPKIRAQIKQWHEQGVSFVDMLERLGISVSQELRSVLDGLSKDEVALIRKVMVDEIDRAGDSADAAMPIDCPQIAPVPVTISETTIRSKDGIKVTPK
jgi:hypothetical protein